MLEGIWKTTNLDLIN